MAETEHSPVDKEQVHETVPFKPEPDWFLRELVDYANRYGLEIGITLQVEGMLVSGTLISGKAYFEEFSAAFAGGFHDKSIGDSFGKLISNFQQIYDVPLKEEELRDVSKLPTYAHIRNAHFFQPGQQAMPKQGALWRGRLSEVGGFFLGALSQD